MYKNISIEALKTSCRGCILLVPAHIFITIVFVFILNINSYVGGEETGNDYFPDPNH